jgi:hypothetical protein
MRECEFFRLNRNFTMQPTFSTKESGWRCWSALGRSAQAKASLPAPIFLERAWLSVSDLRVSDLTFEDRLEKPKGFPPGFGSLTTGIFVSDFADSMRLQILFGHLRIL